MRVFAPALAVLLLLHGCGQPAPQPEQPRELAVDGAWVRLSAVPGRPAAAYFTVTAGSAADRLVAVESDRVATIELHEGGMHGGMMRMRPIAGVDVGPGASQRFAPGGNHAMLFGVDPAVRPGGTLPLAFRFASGQRITREAAVIAAGDPPPPGAGQ